MPSVAPAGAIKPLFGTNPISFAWPRKNKTPVVYDMATASMAMGEVQVAARDGHKVPYGTGLNKDGKYFLYQSKLKTISTFFDGSNMWVSVTPNLNFTIN